MNSSCAAELVRSTLNNRPPANYSEYSPSYLEVLDADTRLFDAELGLAQTELSELSAFVEIYRALGGGWQT
jgi:outer membrane protein TolC